eukprot:Rmarinus@m.25194
MVVIEGVVADVLSRQLGSIVKSLKTEQLKLSIWSGTVVLEKLDVRTDALDPLNLPITVREGSIRRLELYVPWKKLKNEACRLLIDGFHVTTVPKKLDAISLQELAWRSKQSSLTVAEALRKERQHRVSGSESVESEDSYMGRLVTKIIDNMQIEIRDIHFRFEDVIGSVPRTVAVGARLESLTMLSTDKNWKPCFMSAFHVLIYKTCNVSGLALYCEEGVSSRDVKHSESNVFGPVSTKVKAVINKSKKISKPDENPMLSATVEVSGVDCHLDSWQYEAFCTFASRYTHSVSADGDNQRDVLSVALPPPPDARGRWAWAIDTVLTEVARRHGKIRPQAILSRRGIRERYIAAYTSKERLKSMNYDSSAMEAEVETLERWLSVRDIIYFRCLADQRQSMARKAKAAAGKKQASGSKATSGAADAPPGKATAKSGWVSGVLSYVNIWSAAAGKPEIADKASRDARQELDDIFDEFPAWSLPDSALPRGYTKIRCNVSLQSLSACLSDAGKVLTKVCLRGAEVSYSQRPESFSYQIAVGGLEALDYVSSNTKFPVVLMTLSDNSAARDMALPDDSKLLHAVVERNPKSCDAEYAARVQVSRLRAVLNKTYVDAVTVFLRKGIPEESFPLSKRGAANSIHRAMSSVSSYAGSATGASRTWTSAAYTSLFAALTAETTDPDADDKHHKTLLKLSCVVEAPEIVVPVSVVDTTAPVAVLNCGKLSVSSYDEKVDRIDAAFEDHTEFIAANICYDLYSIRLKGTAAYVTTVGSYTRPGGVESVPAKNKLLHSVDLTLIAAAGKKHNKRAHVPGDVSPMEISTMDSFVSAVSSTSSLPDVSVGETSSLRAGPVSAADMSPSTASFRCHGVIRTLTMTLSPYAYSTLMAVSALFSSPATADALRNPSVGDAQSTLRGVLARSASSLSGVLGGRRPAPRNDVLDLLDAVQPKTVHTGLRKPAESEARKVECRISVESMRLCLLQDTAVSVAARALKKQHTPTHCTTGGVVDPNPQAKSMSETPLVTFVLSRSRLVFLHSDATSLSMASDVFMIEDETQDEESSFRHLLKSGKFLPDDLQSNLSTPDIPGDDARRYSDEFNISLSDSDSVDLSFDRAAVYFDFQWPERPKQPSMLEAQDPTLPHFRFDSAVCVRLASMTLMVNPETLLALVRFTTTSESIYPFAEMYCRPQRIMEEPRASPPRVDDSTFPTDFVFTPEDVGRSLTPPAILTVTPPPGAKGPFERKGHSRLGSTSKPAESKRSSTAEVVGGGSVTVAPIDDPTSTTGAAGCGGGGGGGRTSRARADDAASAGGESFFSAASAGRGELAESSMKVNIEIGSVDGGFNNGGVEICKIFLGGTQLSYTYIPPALSKKALAAGVMPGVGFKGDIGAFRLINLYPDAGLYRDVLQIHGEHTVVFDFRGGDPATVASFQTSSDVAREEGHFHDAFLRVKVAPIRYVYTSRFHYRLMEYLGELTETETYLNMAASAAADAIMSGVDAGKRANIKNEDTRNDGLGVRIDVASPLVILPRCQSSPSAFLMDLGAGTVLTSRVLSAHADRDAQGEQRLYSQVDRYKASITSLCLYSIELEKDVSAAAPQSNSVNHDANDGHSNSVSHRRAAATSHLPDPAHGVGGHSGSGGGAHVHNKTHEHPDVPSDGLSGGRTPVLHRRSSVPPTLHAARSTKSSSPKSRRHSLMSNMEDANEAAGGSQSNPDDGCAVRLASLARWQLLHNPSLREVVVNVRVDVNIDYPVHPMRAPPEVPVMDVALTFSPLCLRLSEDQYCMVMALVFDNLAEDLKDVLRTPEVRPTWTVDTQVADRRRRTLAQHVVFATAVTPNEKRESSSDGSPEFRDSLSEPPSPSPQRRSPRPKSKSTSVRTVDADVDLEDDVDPDADALESANTGRSPFKMRVDMAETSLEVLEGDGDEESAKGTSCYRRHPMHSGREETNWHERSLFLLEFHGFLVLLEDEPSGKRVVTIPCQSMGVFLTSSKEAIVYRTVMSATTSRPRHPRASHSGRGETPEEGQPQLLMVYKAEPDGSQALEFELFRPALVISTETYAVMMSFVYNTLLQSYIPLDPEKVLPSGKWCYRAMLRESEVVFVPDACSPFTCGVRLSSSTIECSYVTGGGVGAEYTVLTGITGADMTVVEVVASRMLGRHSSFHTVSSPPITARNSFSAKSPKQSRLSRSPCTPCTPESYSPRQPSSPQSHPSLHRYPSSPDVSYVSTDTVTDNLSQTAEILYQEEDGSLLWIGDTGLVDRGRRVVWPFDMSARIGSTEESFNVTFFFGVLQVAVRKSDYDVIIRCVDTVTVGNEEVTNRYVARYPVAPSVVEESLTVNFQKSSIVLLNIVDEVASPFLLIDFPSSVITVENWSKPTVNIDAVFDVSIDVFNLRFSAWEPAIERSDVKFVVRGYTPTDYPKPGAERGPDAGHTLAVPSQGYRCSLTSTKGVQAVLTPALMHRFQSAQLAWAESTSNPGRGGGGDTLLGDGCSPTFSCGSSVSLAASLASDSGIVSQQIQTFASYVFVNETGYPLRLMLFASPLFSAKSNVEGENGDVVDVPPNPEPVPISIPDTSILRHIKLCPVGLGAEPAIASVDRVGEFPLQMFSESDPRKAVAHLVWTVRVSGDSRIYKLRTTCLVTNRLRFPLELCLATGESKPTTPTTKPSSLKPAPGSPRPSTPRSKARGPVVDEEVVSSFASVIVPPGHTRSLPLPLIGTSLSVRPSPIQDLDVDISLLLGEFDCSKKCFNSQNPCTMNEEIMSFAAVAGDTSSPKLLYARLRVKATAPGRVPIYHCEFLPTIRVISYLPQTVKISVSNLSCGESEEQVLAPETDFGLSAVTFQSGNRLEVGLTEGDIPFMRRTLIATPSPRPNPKGSFLGSLSSKEGRRHGISNAEESLEPYESPQFSKQAPRHPVHVRDDTEKGAGFSVGLQGSLWESVYCIVLYCPYALTNATSLPIMVGRVDKEQRHTILHQEVPPGESVVIQFPSTWDARQRLVSIKTPETGWSDPVHVDSVGLTELTSLAVVGSHRTIDLCCDVSLSTRSLDGGMKILTVKPRYCLYNETPVSVAVCQYDVDNPEVYTVPPGGDLVIYKRYLGVPFRLSIRYVPEQKADGWHWSGGFPVDSAGSYPLCMLHQDVGLSIPVIKIEEDCARAWIEAIVHAESIESPPFVLRNASSKPVAMWQFGILKSEQAKCTIEPGEETRFSWFEYTQGVENEIAVEVHGVVYHCALRRPGLHALSPCAESPTHPHLIHSLDLSKPRPVPSPGKNGSSPRVMHPEARPESLPAVGVPLKVFVDIGAQQRVTFLDAGAVLPEALTKPVVSSAPLVTTSITLAEAGVSIVDGVPEELVYLTMSPVAASIEMTPERTSMIVQVASFQADNAVYGSSSEVILYHDDPVPTPSHPVIGPAFEFRCSRRNTAPSPRHRDRSRSTGSNPGGATGALTYYDELYLGVLRNLTLTLSEDVVVRLMKLFAVEDAALEVVSTTKKRKRNLSIRKMSRTMSRRTSSMGRQLLMKGKAAVSRSSSRRKDKDMERRELQSASDSPRLFFKEFNLNSMRVAVRFDKTTQSGHPGPVSSIVEAMGVVGSSVRVTLKLDSLSLSNLNVTTDLLVNKILQHYKRQSLKQLYKMVGGLNILGNPSELFTNVSTGVKAFFVEPVQGLASGPLAAAKGVHRGTKSLVTSTVYGVSNSASLLTGTLSKGVTVMALDREYAAKREMDRQARGPASNLKQGTKWGLESLGKGLFEGVTGIVSKPVEGAKKEGLAGFGKGMVRGVVGAVTKPVAGVLDLAATTTEGIKNTAIKQEVRHRVRLPRSMGADRLVTRYDPDLAQGRRILYHINANTHVQICTAFGYVANAVAAVVTEEDLLLVNMSNMHVKESHTLAGLIGVFMHSENTVAFRTSRPREKPKAWGERSSSLQVSNVEYVACDTKQRAVWLVTALQRHVIPGHGGIGDFSGTRVTHVPAVALKNVALAKRVECNVPPHKNDFYKHGCQNVTDGNVRVTKEGNENKLDFATRKRKGYLTIDLAADCCIHKVVIHWRTAGPSSTRRWALSFAASNRDFHHEDLRPSSETGTLDEVTINPPADNVRFVRLDFKNESGGVAIWEIEVMGYEQTV